MKASGDEMLNFRCSRSVSPRSKSLSAFSVLCRGLVVRVPLVVIGTSDLDTFGLFGGEDFGLSFLLPPSWSRGFRGNLFTAVVCQKEAKITIML